MSKEIQLNMEKNTDSLNITITEICSGMKAKMRYFGKHSLDANGDVMSFNEQMAVISHYLHNEKYASEKTYKEKAHRPPKFCIAILKPPIPANRSMNVNLLLF